MGVQLGFMGVQLGGKGHRGQVAGEAGAAGSSGDCRRAVPGRAPRDATATARPWHSPLSRSAAFAVSAGHTSGMRSRAALPPPLAGEIPTWQGLGRVSL
jgi:hypothetical protein